MARLRSAVGLGLALAGCGGAAADPKGPPASGSCRAQLSPRTAVLAAAPHARLEPAPSEPPSRLVGQVTIPLAPIAAELEASVGTRLAEERGRDLGFAGQANVDVDRGPFRLAIESDALVVRTDVRARVDVCRGQNCYASCEPLGRAEARIPLRLTVQYGFGKPQVTFAFTRGCEVRVLGGIVKVDVTPTLQAGIAPTLRQVEQQIQARLPPVRPQAERFFREASITRPLPLGRCLVPHVERVVEGPISGTAERATVRFAVLARPELTTRCDAPADPGTRTLPPLAQEPHLAPEEDLVVALVAPVASISLDGTRLDGTRIARAKALPSAGAVLFDLDLDGDVCGPLGVAAPLAWTPDLRALKLGPPVLALGEEERLAQASLPSAKILGVLDAVRIPPSLQPAALQELVPEAAAAASDAHATVRASISSVRPFDVVVRGDDVVARVFVRGSVGVDVR